MGESLNSSQCVLYRCVAHAILVVDHLHTTISDGNIITLTGHHIRIDAFEKYITTQKTTFGSALIDGFLSLSAPASLCCFAKKTCWGDTRAIN